MRKTLAIVAALAASAGVEAAAAEPCAGVDGRLTPARQQHFAPIVAQVVGASAPDVTISDYAQAGDWIFVHASFSELEPAFLFFRTEGAQMRYVDLWGGFTVEEERAEDIAWARGIGVPEGLAACFADTAIGS